MKPVPTITLRSGRAYVCAESLRKFFRANDFTREERRAIVRELRARGSYYGGGGAAPEWSIRLTAAARAATVVPFPDVGDLRARYRWAWSRDWPHGNAYLRELLGEAGGDHVQTLRLMRECHDFREGQL